MLHIIGRDVIGHINSTCIQPNIPSTYVRLPPVGSSGAFTWRLHDARIPPEFNSILQLKVCYHHLGDRVTLRMYLYYLLSMLPVDFSSLVFSVFEVRDLHIAYSNWNCLSDCLIFKFGLLRHIIVGHTSNFFCERLNFNPFSQAFVQFTIVVLTWYDFTLYSKVLPMSILS